MLDKDALARCLPLVLGRLEHGRPAEVAALGTLGGLEVLEAVTPCHAARAALEAFHDEGIHSRSIGGFERAGVPPTGDSGSASTEL